MSGDSAPLESSVTGVLQRCATRVARPGPAEWSFDLGNGKPIPVLARREEGWLRLVAPAHLQLETGGATPWGALQLNGLLPGAVRVVRHPRPAGGGLVLQADLPLEDEALVADRLETICGALRAAVPLLAGTSNPAAPVAAAGKNAEADAALVELARERGWQLECRDANRFSTELDAPGMPSHASLERQEGGLSVWIEVLRCGALSEASRRAVGLFLLTLTAQLRMVRGSAGGDPVAVRLEVRLAAVPSGSELDLALAALSLACRLCTRELKGLADDLLAQAYLDLNLQEE